MSLGLEDIEIAIGEAEAVEESRDAAIKAARASARRRTRGSLCEHLLRIEQVVDVEDKTCSCCAGADSCSDKLPCRTTRICGIVRVAIDLRALAR